MKILKLLFGLSGMLLSGGEVFTQHSAFSVQRSVFTPHSALRTPHSEVVCFAPPLDWKPGMHIPKSHPKKMPDMKPMRARGMMAPAIARAMGTTGTKKIAVILMTFSSFGGSGTTAPTQGNLTTPTFEGSDLTNLQLTYFAKLKEYYLEASYGQLTLNISFVGSNGVSDDPSTLAPFAAAQSMSFYGANNDVNASTFIRDAILLATSLGVTSTNYDAVIAVHAGYGNESTTSRSGSASSGDNGDIWSLVANFAVANGFTEGAAIPAREAKVVAGTVTGTYPVTGVLCHEFGHILGLPDLYDTSSGRSKWVAKWDIMDFGTWNGTTPGERPSHFSGWSKIQLNWLTPTTIASSTNITLQPLASSATNSVYKMAVPGSTTEYFLLEYRKLTGYDDALPGAGMAIWHVDDTVGTFAANDVNASATRPRLKLVEADDNSSIVNSGTAESTDVFNTSSQLFKSTQSDSYSGSQTGITVSNFTGSGGATMRALASLIAATTSLEVKKTFSYPNPVRSSTSTSTTIRIVFSRPVTTANLRIYNVAGELVRMTDLSQNDFQAAKSQDLEWVYEYPWDLKNSSGAAVATGVYVYAVEGATDSGKQTVVGKVAIIR